MGRARRQSNSKAQKALAGLAAARAGCGQDDERLRLPRSHNVLIDSSASEASVRSRSSDDSDEGTLRRVGSGSRPPLSRRRGQGRAAKQYIKFGEGSFRREDEKFDSASDLDDFLAPDDEVETSSHDGGGDEDFEGTEMVVLSDEEQGIRSFKKRARCVVDSESSDSGDGSKKKKKRLLVSESEEEEWDLAHATSEVKQNVNVENADKRARSLRERKSIRDQHGGLSPLQRIKTAQRRALGIQDGADGADGTDGVGQDADEMVENGRRKPNMRTQLSSPSSSGTTSTLTRSTSGGSEATSTSTSTSTVSASSTSTSSSSEDSFVSNASIDPAERRRVQDLMMAEAGSMSHMSEEEAFRVYMELLFCSSIDPEYEKRVQASEAHLNHYATAKAKIEYLIITAQQYAHSQAWVNCDAHLLEAVEQYSRFEIRRQTKRRTHEANNKNNGEMNEDDDMNCAACNKRSDHKTNEMCALRFIGRRHENAIVCPGESKLGEGMRLSHNYLIASPVYQQNRGLWGKGKRPECREECVDEQDGDRRRNKSRVQSKKNKSNKPPSLFYMGKVCCRRITTFHALLHFRRHCLLYLKRRAKAIIDRHSDLSMDELLDHVFHEDAHKLMYACFRGMLDVARTMQLSSGFDAQYAVSRHGAFRTRAPQEVLLADEGTDVSSLDWRGEEVSGDVDVSSSP